LARFSWDSDWRIEIEGGKSLRNAIYPHPRLIIILIVVSLSFSISTSAVFAIGDDDYSRLSLRGLKKLSVVVQIEKPISEDFRKAGLTEDRIRAAIELKLQEAKIDIVYRDLSSSDTPILHIEVEGSSKEGKTYSFLIAVELWQKAFLKRDSKVEVIAGTWSTGVFGVGSVQNMANNVMGLINSMMDTFVKAYLSVNSHEKRQD
jgi:hypothetical protein